MGRRKKIPSENTETLICKQQQPEEEIGAKGFFACYLLTSLSPRHKGHTYIGFTVNPRRRIRQHNGEIRCGAGKTKSKRPWEMVLCIHGFPTNVSALQFEWAWQHPTESLAVRKAAATFKSLSGIANKIKLAYTMLTLPAWQSLSLTINFFSTKYTKHSSGCPSLPEQVKVQIRLMDELPCYMAGEDTYDNEDDEEECNEVESANGFTMEGLPKSKTFVGCHDCIERPSHERDGWMVENGIRQPWYSPTSKEDRRYPLKASFASTSITGTSITEETAKYWGFIQESSIDLDRPIRKRSPTATISDDIKDQPAANTEETAKEEDIFGSIESSVEIVQPTRKRRPLITGDDKGQRAISFRASCEIEVIDVLTPSPDYRISLLGKKRRVSTVWPEIIDLTKLPAFVQL